MWDFIRLTNTKEQIIEKSNGNDSNPNLNCLGISKSFSSRISLSLYLFFISKQEHSHSMLPKLPCFTIEMRCLLWCATSVFCDILEVWKKSERFWCWSHPTKAPSAHVFAVYPTFFEQWLSSCYLSQKDFFLLVFKGHDQQLFYQSRPLELWIFIIKPCFKLSVCSQWCCLITNNINIELNWLLIHSWSQLIPMGFSYGYQSKGRSIKKRHSNHVMLSFHLTVTR